MRNPVLILQTFEFFVLDYNIICISMLIANNYFSIYLNEIWDFQCQLNSFNNCINVH